MASSPMSVVVQTLMADLRPEGVGTTDGELLARFLSDRDDDALAALVRRHAPMVWGVCCRLLRHTADAEDAFQATFLVLVRKAGGVPRGAVANWLYSVARQTAVRLRATAAKRGRRETQVVNMPEPTVAEVQDADLQAVLDEELSRLPAHYRGVIVLCDLEDMTRRDAAQELGIPEGSVASRLARARAMLAKRLARRGVVFSGPAAVLSAGAVASAPPALVASTIKAASLLAAGQAAGVVSVKVAALTEGVLKAMLLTKLKTGSAVLAVVLLVAGGGWATGLLAQDKGGSSPAPRLPDLQPPGVKQGNPLLLDDPQLVTESRVALDANGGKGKPTFRSPDSASENQLWKFKKVGEYHMIVPKVADVALVAARGRDIPYFLKADPDNDNHLWRLRNEGDSYLIIPKVADRAVDCVMLDASDMKTHPRLSEPNWSGNNDLLVWQLRKVGDYYMIVPMAPVSKDLAPPAPKKDLVSPAPKKDLAPPAPKRRVEKKEPVALDAAGGKNKLYFNTPDPTNHNLLWQLKEAGDYHMIVSRIGGLALDAAGGRDTPYLLKPDPTNINHLWKITKIDDLFVIQSRVDDLALDAAGGDGFPRLSKPDPTNNDHLWQLKKEGEWYMLVPFSRGFIPEKRPGVGMGMEGFHPLPEGKFPPIILPPPGERVGKQVPRTGKQVLPGDQKR